MKISIIIPNYNGAELINKNFKTIVAALIFFLSREENKAEIIFVDDGSKDNSLAIIEKEKSVFSKNENINIEIIKNKKNEGFSHTVNKGVDAATGEIVILLNTDVSPNKDFLSPLMSHFSDQKVFAVGCMDRSIENGKTVLRGRGIGQWMRGFLVHKRGDIDKTDTLWVNGGSGAFRRSIWKKLGGFNTLYSPFYWEDIDLSYRALKSGYKLVFEARSIVDHRHEEGTIKMKFSDEYIKTIAYRNQFIFAWENATDLSLQFFHILWLPYHLLRAFLSFNFPFIAGFVRALVHFPKVIISSFKYQKHFVKSDREVVEQFLS